MPIYLRLKGKNWLPDSRYRKRAGLWEGSREHMVRGNSEKGEEKQSENGRGPHNENRGEKEEGMSDTDCRPPSIVPRPLRGSRT